MTSQFDFTNDEWDRLASSPVLVGMAVAKAEDSGFLGSIRETRTLQSTIDDEAGPNAAADLIAQAAATDTDAHYERFKLLVPESLASEAVEACRQVAEILDRVAEPGEADGFKRWLVDVGVTVAEAAKEGGTRVSVGEAELLDEFRSSLGLS